MSTKSGSKNTTTGQVLQTEISAMTNTLPQHEKQLLTSQELLEQELDNVISYDQLLILTKTGQIPFVTLGNRRFYRRQTIRDWFADMEKTSFVVPEKAVSLQSIKKFKGGKSA